MKPAPSHLIVRPYHEQDEAAVVEIWRAVFPHNPSWNEPAEDIRCKLSMQRDLFLVGEWDGQVVATTMAGFDGHRGWLHLVAVLPEYRRRGVGRAILLEAERRLAGLGCSKINLQVRAGNTHFVPFYEGLGYAVEDRISMGKRLAATARAWDDASLLQAFEDCSFPLEQWTHRAHVRVAYLYLTQLSHKER